jgi:hypothetical protein
MPDAEQGWATIAALSARADRLLDHAYTNHGGRVAALPGDR